MKFFIVGFELLFFFVCVCVGGGGSIDVTNCNFLISVFMEYMYKNTFPNI